MKSKFTESPRSEVRNMMEPLTVRSYWSPGRPSGSEGASQPGWRAKAPNPDPLQQFRERSPRSGRASRGSGTVSREPRERARDRLNVQRYSRPSRQARMLCEQRGAVHSNRSLGGYRAGLGFHSLRESESDVLLLPARRTDHARSWRGRIVNISSLEASGRGRSMFITALPRPESST